jgi:hypothetical protein
MRFGVRASVGQVARLGEQPQRASLAVNADEGRQPQGPVPLTDTAVVERIEQRALRPPKMSGRTEKGP